MSTVDELAECGILPVLRAREASEYAPVCRALVDGGVTVLELTLTTPGTIDAIADLRRSLPAETRIGVGTVLAEEDCRGALDAGADFIVTPTVNAAATRAALERGVPIFAGALTPTEVHANRSLGAGVKLFPAGSMGIPYLAQLRGPFPDLEVVPSGGIELADVADWIRAGAIAVSLGGSLVGDAFRGGDLGALTARAAAARGAVAEAREARR